MTEFDDTLSRLFAEARQTLPAEDFLENVVIRMRHERRRRTIKQAALMTAAAGLAVALTPYVVEVSLTGGAHLSASMPELGNALASPVAWICSLGVAAWGRRSLRTGSRFR